MNQKTDVIARLEAENQRLRMQMAALEQETARFRVFVEGTDDLITQVDAAGTLTYVNASAEHVLGLPPAACIGTSVFEYIHPDDRERTQQAFVGWIRRQEHSVTFENRLVHRDGTVFQMLWTISLHYDDQGQMIAANSICRDVGALHQFRVQAHESRTILQLVIDNLPQAVFWKDRTSRFLGCNQFLVADTGLESAEAIIGRTDNDLPWRDLAEKYQAEDREVMAGNALLNCEEYLASGDGAMRWLRISKLPLSQGSTIIGVLGMYEDITARKQQQEQLRAFHALAEAAPDGIALIDLNGYISYANPSYRSLLGYSDEIVGLDIRQLLATPDPIKVEQEIDQALTEHGLWQGQMTRRRKDGSTFEAQVSLFMVFDDAGTPFAIAAIIRDITAQIRTEQERQALQEQVIDAQQAALRELSTPLMPIAEGVVVMPIIGSIDSARAQQIMEALLDGISTYRAQIAILDITGVKVVDTHVAGALIRAAQAARLLGTRVVVSGISPEIAQTLVHIGIELREMIAMNSLQHGIAYALAHRPASRT